MQFHPLQTHFISALLLIPLFGLLSNTAARADDALFENEIRPLLTKRCIKCHGAKKQESSLRLDSESNFRKGGENGATISAKSVDTSLLLKVLSYDGDIQMPPEGKLSKHEIASVAKWIKLGAAWPKNATLGETSKSSSTLIRSGPITEKEKSFWSLLNLRKVTPPAIANSNWVKNDIDRFVLTNLRKSKMTPAPMADRRTLIRRATYDLTGLPPTPAEIDAFLQDKTSNAFEKVVNRLLNSEAYGEKWGRHWLDVVRYADTAGETADFPVPEAYKYRNWVIESFNEDKPYDQFVREQIAGDLIARKLALDKKTVDQELLDRYRGLITATGFVAISRRFGFDSENYHYLTIQDTIDTIGQAMLGLSLGCARCHDHKYDPVNKEDYYALYGIFESTRYPFPGSEQKKRPRDFVKSAPPQVTKRHSEKLSEINRKIAKAESELSAQKNAFAKSSSGNAYLTKVLANLLDQFVDAPDGHKGFQVWRDEMTLPVVGVNSSDKLLQVPGDAAPKSFVVHPANGLCVVVGWQSPIDAQIEISGRVADAHSFGDSVAWHVDHIGKHGFRNIASGNVDKNGSQLLKDGQNGARLSNLKVQKGDLIQIAISPKSNIGADLTSLEFQVTQVENEKRVWDLAKDTVDNLHESGKGNPHSDKYGNSNTWYFYKAPDKDRGKAWAKGGIAGKETYDIDQFLAEIEKLNSKIAKSKKQYAETENQKPYQLVYAVSEGKIKNSKIHIRGNQKELGNEVPRRNLEIFGGQKLRQPKQSSGRLELANWMTSKNNPLFARVMVNRIWQHHFDEGIVRTENDFGVRGTRPTHPKLLDWLATNFINSGWSIKQMHRLIMNSATYQMSSEFSEAFAKRDPENANLWRFNRRRLSAEEIRDSILAISGQLDHASAGAHPFPDTKSWGFTQHTPFYAVYETKRRSIYLMQQRLKRHPFLALFDGADPNVAVADRMITITPTQALFLMNNPFVHQNSKHFSKKLIAEHKDVQSQIKSAFTKTLARLPTKSELVSSIDFQRNYKSQIGDQQDAEQLALAAFVRTLFSRNEFLFLD